MLQNMLMCKEENIATSKALVAELADAGITDQRRTLLLAKLEGLTGDVLRPIVQEVLTDSNSLGALLRGNLISKRVEAYDQEVDNRAKIDRYGWEVIVIEGKKMMFDPAKAEPKYEVIPKMVVEKIRTIYEVSTNREAIGKIEELLQAFLVRVRGEFKRASIDVILEAKRLAELEISKIDRSVLTKSTMNEADFTNSAYIKKPFDRYKQNPISQDADLFRRFDSFKGAV